MTRATLPARIDWDKGGGLVPAIVQDADDDAILMLGYLYYNILGESLMLVNMGLIAFGAATQLAVGHPHHVR